MVWTVSFFFCFSLFTTFSLAYPLVPAIYAFGDSLVDVGNNNYLIFSLVKANFPHNGVDFPTKKATGRFCNGKNAVDLLAEKVGLPRSPPYLSTVFNLEKRENQFLTGVNFGSGGSGIMNRTNQESHLSKSLFVIVTGSNDIFSYFGSADLRNKTTPSQYINSMVDTLKGQVKRLYNLGARKYVIVGIGLIGCTPSERKRNKAEQCNEEVNHISVKYNGALNLMLKGLKVELKDINYSYFDGYSVMQNFVQKPAAYGFSEVKAACCGLGKLKADVPCLPFSTFCSNRSNHLFWDASHPTETAHRIFVDYIFDGPLLYTFPLNVKKLIAT
ncbi:Lipase [Parasponia andersonii]|uniref:Lipase n=1 Tax=Parasponia andersonii TaxID=3476 RepID=A0A2P5CNT6_PARAD|nr:Lipase [Parasponia andersonii]